MVIHVGGGDHRGSHDSLFSFSAEVGVTPTGRRASHTDFR